MLRRPKLPELRAFVVNIPLRFTGEIMSSTIDLITMRVDLVGSMLRPQSLKDAFAKYGKGEASETELKKVQDVAIRELVAKQTQHNMPIVVDGEFRRTSFMESFAVVQGVEEWRARAVTMKFLRVRMRGKKAHTRRRIQSYSIANV